MEKKSFFSYRGVARIFQRGGGRGHTVSNIIVMAFSPRNIVGCLLKKRLTKGAGSRAPQDPPRYALEFSQFFRSHGSSEMTNLQQMIYH